MTLSIGNKPQPEKLHYDVVVAVDFSCSQCLLLYLTNDSELISLAVESA